MNRYEFSKLPLRVTPPRRSALLPRGRPYAGESATVRREGYDVGDAQDLTQAFFVHLLTGPLFAKADPARGRFRCLLVVSLKRFLINDAQRARAAKRGGEAFFIPLDESSAQRLRRTWTSQGGFEVSPDKKQFAFSPDGRWLVSTGLGLVLWETASGRRLATLVSALRDQEEPLHTVVFTPDGRWLIAGGLDTKIHVWDLAAAGRQRVGTFTGHLGSLVRLAVSPDGKTLGSGSSTGKIKLWRLEPPDGRFKTRWEIRELLTLAEGSEGILDLQFCRTSDGEILASSDAGGVVHLWRADAAPSQSQDRNP